MGDRVFLFGSVIFCISAGVYSWYFSAPPVSQELETSVGTSTTLEALVVTEPVRKENRQRFVVSAAQGKISVSAELYPTLAYGDRVSLQGVIRKPESFTTEHGQVFNYPRYLAKDGIGYTLSFPVVEVLEHGGGNFVKKNLFLLRRVFLRALAHVIPQPSAALLGGITVGAEDGMTEHLEEVFRDVGLVHIIVLSGYNITIVADAIQRLLSRFPLFISWAGSGVSIVLFVLMTGASPATVRAGLMALLVIVARAVGRRYDMGRALMLAGALMVLHNPDVLLFDPSFQLSFLATLGLLYGASLMAPVTKYLPEQFGIRESATATLATQLFVFPLLIYRTGEVSVIALLANILVLWTMPAGMSATFAAGLVGMVAPSVALPFGLVAHGIASYVLVVAELLARVPFASVAVGVVPSIVLCGAYGVLFFIVRRRHQGAAQSSPS